MPLTEEVLGMNADGSKNEDHPGGVTDPNYCVLKFSASDGRFYSDFYPRSFVIE
jgi:general stress protein 26